MGVAGVGEGLESTVIFDHDWFICASESVKKVDAYCILIQ